mgnify:CR=1 FL=1
MQPFYIEPSFDTPEIILDSGKGIFSIIGRSLPENAVKYYSPVFEWLNSYIDNPNRQTIFNINLEYSSSSSAKQISKLLSLLEKLSDYSEVIIRWHYTSEDNELKMFGEKLSKIINLKFEFIELDDY